MSDYKKYAFYIYVRGGTCLFSIEFSPMPQSALITAMLSAMQAFINEISGDQAKKLSTGGFVFHMESMKEISLVIATSSEERPPELAELRTVFLHKFGSQIGNFTGDTSLFLDFEEDVLKILQFDKLAERIEPTNKLNAYSLLQIRPELQAIAKEAVLKKETRVIELSKILDRSHLIVQMQLEELFDLGFLGKYYDKGEIVYFLWYEYKNSHKIGLILSQNSYLVQKQAPFLYKRTLINFTANWVKAYLIRDIFAKLMKKWKNVY